MKAINLLTAVSALVMAATPAFASNWVYVDTDAYRTVYHYDAETIKRSANQVTVWEKSDHSRDKTYKEREKRLHNRYDCAARTRTIINVVTYYPDGTNETLNVLPNAQEAYPVVPDTIGETMLKAICGDQLMTPSVSNW
jgi:hypothetical protein